MLQQAVRDADFTPTGVRFWVQGTLERSPAPEAGDLVSAVLVSAGSVQRFVLAPGADGGGARDSLSSAGASTVTAWGIVTKREGTPGLVLHVEGHRVDER